MQIVSTFASRTAVFFALGIAFLMMPACATEDCLENVDSGVFCNGNATLGGGQGDGFGDGNGDGDGDGNGSGLDPDGDGDDSDPECDGLAEGDSCGADAVCNDKGQCRDVNDDDGDGYCPSGVDLDGDGKCDGDDEIDSDDYDCNDDDANINAGEPEICDDGIDNDCDGDIDGADADCGGDGSDPECDGLAEGDSCGADAVCNDKGQCKDVNDDDSDGYCPSGVDLDGDGKCDGDDEIDSDDYDCNDDDASINAGEPEICDDGIDNDCDGDVDGADADCDGGTDGENVDGDGDGYCPSGQDLNDDGICSPTDGGETGGGVPGDCDDTNAAVNPGAMEICDNFIDDDCNGLIDAADVEACGVSDPNYTDGDGDGFCPMGQDLNGDGDCDDPNEPTLVTRDSDCNDSDPLINPNAAEVCNGVDDNCDGVVDPHGTCPGNCTGGYYAGHSYIVCGHDKRWHDAYNFCQKYGFKLARVDNAAENEWMRTFAKQSYDIRSFWIGGKDPKNRDIWEWRADGEIFYVKGAPELTDLYTNWAPGEPNNYRQEDCLEMENGYWDDRDCRDGNQPMCERY